MSGRNSTLTNAAAAATTDKTAIKAGAVKTAAASTRAVGTLVAGSAASVTKTTGVWKPVSKQDIVRLSSTAETSLLLCSTSLLKEAAARDPSASASIGVTLTPSWSPGYIITASKAKIRATIVTSKAEAASSTVRYVGPHTSSSTISGLLIVLPAKKRTGDGQFSTTELPVKRPDLGSSKVTGKSVVEPAKLWSEIGLDNLGNTCYLNCICQFLWACPRFVAQLDCNKHSFVDGSLAQNFMNLMQATTVLTRENMMALLIANVNDFLVGANIQQDAHEFLIMCINSIRESLGIGATLAFDHFSVHDIRCQGCSRRSFVKSEATVVSVSFTFASARFGGPIVIGLLDLLKEEFNSPFELNCGTKIGTNVCSSQTLNARSFETLPLELIVHVKRPLHLDDANRPVSFPYILDMGTCLSRDLMTARDPTGNHDYKALYSLNSFVVRTGNRSGGHFVTLAKNKAGEWLQYNDAKVTKQTKQDIQKIASGSMFVYLLQYSLQ